MQVNNMDKLKKPIIFMGTGRSGTTVISEVMLRHRDLAFPANYNEKFSSLPMVGLVRHIFDNPAWRVFGLKDQPEVNKVALANRYLFIPSEAWHMWEYITGPEVNFSRGFLLGQKPSPERIEFIRNYFAAMLKYQARKRLGMKITGPSRFEYLTNIFPDAVFVNIVRNPVPVISSFLKSNFWSDLGMKQLWWTGAYTESEIMAAAEHSHDPVWMTAFQLKKVIDETKRERDKIQPAYLEIRYEDFVKDSEGVIKGLLERLGLDFDDACMDYIVKNKIQQRNKADGEYFNSRDLQTIYSIFDIST